MFKISSALTITIIFSASVSFGQVNSGAAGGASQAAMGAAASSVAAAMLFMEADEKWTEAETLDSEAQTDYVNASAMVKTNPAGAKALHDRGVVKETAGAKKNMMGFVFAGMGGLSGMQGLYQLSTVAAASQAQGESSYQGTDFAGNDFEMSLPNGRTLNSSQMRDLLNKQTADLAKRGVKLDGKGNMTMPDGKTASLDDLTNGNAGTFAAATGLGPAEMKEIAEKLNGVNARVAAQFGANGKEMKLAMSGGGSSGYQGSSESTGGSKFDFNSLFGKTKPKDRSAASFTGPAKLFRGQPIGVSQDDIFKMVSRRYQEKSKTNYFILGN